MSFRVLSRLHYAALAIVQNVTDESCSFVRSVLYLIMQRASRMHRGRHISVRMIQFYAVLVTPFNKQDISVQLIALTTSINNRIPAIETLLQIQRFLVYPRFEVSEKSWLSNTIYKYNRDTLFVSCEAVQFFIQKAILITSLITLVIHKILV